MITLKIINILVGNYSLFDYYLTDHYLTIHYLTSHCFYFKVKTSIFKISRFHKVIRRQLLI